MLHARSLLLPFVVGLFVSPVATAAATSQFGVRAGFEASTFSAEDSNGDALFFGEQVTGSGGARLSTGALSFDLGGYTTIAGGTIEGGSSVEGGSYGLFELGLESLAWVRVPFGAVGGGLRLPLLSAGAYEQEYEDIDEKVKGTYSVGGIELGLLGSFRLTESLALDVSLARLFGAGRTEVKFEGEFDGEAEWDIDYARNSLTCGVRWAT